MAQQGHRECSKVPERSASTGERCRASTINVECRPRARSRLVRGAGSASLKATLLFSRRAASLTLYCVATANKCHDNVPPSVCFDVIKVDMRRVLLFLP